jgi:hypothetical protein
MNILLGFVRKILKIKIHFFHFFVLSAFNYYSAS